MGEIADLMLDGALCEQCGGAISDGAAPGYPRLCAECGGGNFFDRTNCPVCGKRVKTNGLQDHQRAVHGTETSNE